MRKTLMAVGACLLFVLTACTKDCSRCVEVYGDEATIYLDDAGSSAEVREAILDADSKGVVSYTVIGSAARVGLSSNPFADTRVESLDLKSVTSWPARAIPGAYFYGESFPCLENVILPDEVQSIGRSAFYHCDRLKNVEGTNVTNIEDGAFLGCADLQSAVFPNVITLGSNVFSHCISLVSAEMPELRTTGNNTFDSCTSLKSIDFPKLEVAYLSFCFACTGLEFVNLPSARKIEGDAFSMCSSLKDIYVPEARYVSGFLACTSLTRLSLQNVNDLGNIGFSETPLEYLELSASGNITYGEYTFANSLQPFASENCVLVLNADKRPGGGCTPVADPETNTWAGVRWKQILFAD